MSIRNGIEEKVLSALRTLLGDAATVTGFLEAAAAGTIKEAPAGRPEVRVTVAPGAAAEWASSEVQFSVKINVRLDLEDDATQSAFVTVCGSIEELINTWNMDQNWSEVSDALGTDRYRVDGFREDAGSDAIGLTATDPYISTTFNFTLMGCIIPLQSNQQQENNNE